MQPTEKDKNPEFDSQSRIESANRQNSIIDSFNNTSFYLNQKINHCYIKSDNVNDQNSQIQLNKAKKINDIPRPKINEGLSNVLENQTKINNLPSVNKSSISGNILEQIDSAKMNIVNNVSKRHSSFSKGRAKEHNQQLSALREEKKGNEFISQHRRTTETSTVYQEQDSIHYKKIQNFQKYSQKDCIFENQNKFVRQKDVIAYNKENLEKNLIKLNQIKMVEKQKGVYLMRGLDHKKNYQIKKIHQQYNFEKIQSNNNNNNNNKQLAYLQKSVNINRNYKNNPAIRYPINTTQNDNQLIKSFANENNNIVNEQQDSHFSYDQDKNYSNQNQVTLKTELSYRGRSSKRIQCNDDSGNEESFYLNNKTSICLDKIKTEKDEVNNIPQKEFDGSQLNSVSNFSFSVAFTDQKRYRDACEERSHLQTEQEDDEITKKEWIKLHLDGNKIKNLPSNIEEEYNRIQKLSEKNKIALQEYIAIRQQIIQIQSKNRIVN